MIDTDYVVRSQRSAGGRHTTFTVVDMRGNVLHVTIPDWYTTPRAVELIIRARVHAHARRQLARR